MEFVEKPLLRTDYIAHEVDPDWLRTVHKPPRYIGFIPELCILCEGCVDICPWYCIHMLDPKIIAETTDDEVARDIHPDDILFIIDDDACTRCNLCVERCPTGALTMTRLEGQKGKGRPLGLVGLDQKRTA